MRRFCVLLKSPATCDTFLKHMPRVFLLTQRATFCSHGHKLRVCAKSYLERARESRRSTSQSLVSACMQSWCFVRAHVHTFMCQYVCIIHHGFARSMHRSVSRTFTRQSDMRLPITFLLFDFLNT
jgi:hypothetical protein